MTSSLRILDKANTLLARVEDDTLYPESGTVINVYFDQRFVPGSKRLRCLVIQYYNDHDIAIVNGRVEDGTYLALVGDLRLGDDLQSSFDPIISAD